MLCVTRWIILYLNIDREGREYSYSLDAINFYWQGYLSLMKHWDAAYGEKIFHVSYERLVRRPNETISEILGYAALDQEPACFSPHQTSRAINTPSAAQVREPINTKGAGSGLCYKQSLIKKNYLRLRLLKSLQTILFLRSSVTGL